MEVTPLQPVAFRLSIHLSVHLSTCLLSLSRPAPSIDLLLSPSILSLHLSSLSIYLVSQISYLYLPVYIRQFTQLSCCSLHCAVHVQLVGRVTASQAPMAQ